MPKILHGVNTSPPYRAVLVTARALGVKLEVQSWDLLDKKEQMTEPFLKMNPAHTVPVLDDDGFYIWESRAIMAYLVSKYGKDDKLYPKDVKQRATVDTILHFDNGSVWSNIVQYLAPQVFKGEPANAEVEEAIRDKLTALERILSDRPYLAGDHLTIADISVTTSILFLPAAGISLDPYPKLKALMAKVKSDLPFYDEINNAGLTEFIAFFDSKTKK